MDNNEILDRPETRKRFSGQWMGAKYFGLGVVIVVAITLISYAIQWLIGGHLDSEHRFWYLPALLAGGSFLFLNVVGTIMSITYIVSGNNREEKFAGTISLLLNISPYLGVLILYLIDF